MTVVAFEGASRLGLWYLEHHRGLRYRPLVTTRLGSLEPRIRELIAGTSQYIVHDPVLGWSLRPGARVERSLDVRGSTVPITYSSNPEGLRGDRSYPPVPPPGTRRVLAFGDSFTHGDDVSDAECWARRIEELDPSTEVLNHGVPGYGPDQALLRFREVSAGVKGNRVLIGFMSENIKRIVNSFRPFYIPRTSMPLSKPRFTLRRGDPTGGLVLLDNPLPSIEHYRELLRDPARVLDRLGQTDLFFQEDYHEGPIEFLATIRLAKLVHWSATSRERFYRDGRYNTDSPAYRLCRKILGSFADEVAQAGGHATLVIFPTRWDLTCHLRSSPRTYDPLLEDLKAAGYTVVDAVRAFDDMPQATTPDQVFGRQHFSAEGNDRVARYLLAQLRR